eukprot:542761-Pleurochrysis_carterae.AAC.1
MLPSTLRPAAADEPPAARACARSPQPHAARGPKGARQAQPQTLRSRCATAWTHHLEPRRRQPGLRNSIDMVRVLRERYRSHFRRQPRSMPGSLVAPRRET